MSLDAYARRDRHFHKRDNVPFDRNETSCKPRRNPRNFIDTVYGRLVDGRGVRRTRL